MPEPDIRIDAFGEITPTDRRLFVRGDFFTAEQMRKMFEAGRASVATHGAVSFEHWAKERGHPLCDVIPKYGPASSSPETVLRLSDIAREAWDAATERAAKELEDRDGIANRLQNSVNWMLQGKHTGPLVSTADYLKLLEWLGAAAVRGEKL